MTTTLRHGSLRRYPSSRLMAVGGTGLSSFLPTESTLLVECRFYTFLYSWMAASVREVRDTRESDFWMHYP